MARDSEGNNTSPPEENKERGGRRDSTDWTASPLPIGEGLYQERSEKKQISKRGAVSRYIWWPEHLFNFLALNSGQGPEKREIRGGGPGGIANGIQLYACGACQRITRLFPRTRHKQGWREERVKADLAEQAISRVENQPATSGTPSVHRREIQGIMRRTGEACDGDV